MAYHCLICHGNTYSAKGLYNNFVYIDTRHKRDEMGDSSKSFSVMPSKVPSNT